MANQKEKEKWLLMASIQQIIEELVAYFRNFMYLCTGRKIEEIVF